MALLPILDTDPDHWGPEHDEIVLDPIERQLAIVEGNRQGQSIDPEDDEDNGLDPDLSL